MKMCALCNKRPASVFISNSDGRKVVNEGYCLSCAIKSGITPITQLADQFSIEPEELQNMVDGMENMLDSEEFEEAFADMLEGG